MISPQFNTPKVISVSQLNFYIKSLLDNDMNLNAVFITGEISNLTDHYKSGHIYLSLKDDKSVIKAVMFSGNAKRLRFTPENGMKVLVCGRVAVYEPTGQYQLYIEEMQPAGMGELSLAYEQLKTKLEKLGMFDKSRKKPIPKFPKTVGVITSPTGAAIQDIKNILTRRFPCVNIVIAPVLVQGESAPQQLVDAVNKMDFYNIADVIIIGRGGGSIEDLWAFNSEELAFAIYNCNTPVISAVGHETDFTICDFVSDLRAPTPSAAAELAVPDKNELIAYYNSQRQYIYSMIDSKLQSHYRELKAIQSEINANSPVTQINNYYSNLKVFKEKVLTELKFDFEKNAQKINSLANQLEALNPVSVLKRGYSFSEKDGKVLTSVKQVKTDDVININLSDGKISAKVLGE
ncbi:MAG: exodeoxyribonuclease VII large subunit [Ruminococcus sp.]|nr:exodeoxyribonuclease VII large subunit [Ruminococcus sp.]